MARLLLPIVFAALLSGGCAGARAREIAAAPSPSERERLAGTLSDSFSSDARFAGVTVSVDGRRPGVVTLKGDVRGREEAADAGRLAASAQGVKVVYNLLDVERPAPRAKAARSSKKPEIVAETR